jgi:hypothetical protein
MFPDFLCIGAQKAGTTWLHDNLSRQPNIWVPPVKELHFLDHPPPSLAKRLFSRLSHHATARKNVGDSLSGFLSGRGSFYELRAAWHIAFGGRHYRWYEKIFKGHEQAICGEICPGYASLPPEKIAEITARHPKIRIIYLLRDPVDRAWSSMAMHFRKVSDSVAMQDRIQVLDRFQSLKSLNHSAYDRNLGNWLRYVKPDQIYLGWFERILSEPAQLLQEILIFLGASGQILSEHVDQPVNSGAGEVIDPVVERRMAMMLRAETISLHARLNSPHTQRWVARIERILALDAARGAATADEHSVAK